MPCCFAPGCDSGYQRNKSKERHFFRPPTDATKLELWRQNVPRKDKALTNKCYLCDLHFDAKYIIKADTFVVDGKEVSIKRERWKLLPDAYPTVWPNRPDSLAKYLPRKRKEPSSESAAVHEPSKRRIVALNEKVQEKDAGDTKSEEEAPVADDEVRIVTDKQVALQNNDDANKTESNSCAKFTWEDLIENKSQIVLPSENWAICLSEQRLVICKTKIHEGCAIIDIQLVIDRSLIATTFARNTDGPDGVSKCLGLGRRISSLADISATIQLTCKRINKMRYLRSHRISRRKRLQQVHFESSEFEQKRQDGKKRLKPNAIPTLFPNRAPIRVRKQQQSRGRNAMTVSRPKKFELATASIGREHDHQYTPKTPKDDPDVDIHDEEDIEITDCDVDSKPGTVLVPYDPYTPEELVKLMHAQHPVPIRPCPSIQLTPTPLAQRNTNNPYLNQSLTPLLLIRRKLEMERKKVRKMERERQNLTQNLKRFLNQDQVDSLAKRSSRGSKWSLQTLQTGIELFLTCGARGYKMLIDKGYPLPSRRTLRKRLEVVHVDPEKLRLLKKEVGELQKQISD